ncbi:MAG: DUF5522 domain-containing protein [Pyrinomonadaceae bacterium]
MKDGKVQALQTSNERQPLVEGVDFYREGAYVVFTAAYHLRRGHCCESGCRHCPYGETVELHEEGRERDAE